MDAVGALVDRDHRRLEEDDPLAAPEDDGVRRSQIDRELVVPPQ